MNLFPLPASIIKKQVTGQNHVQPNRRQNRSNLSPILKTKEHQKKMVWQVKNSENKEENSNHFNPLGEKKEVPSTSTSGPLTHEALRNDSTKVNIPVTSQIGELKDQTDYPNDIAEVVADTFEGKQLQEKYNQPEEGEIPDSQEEKTDSSLLMPSLEIQEAQKCAILGLNLSDSNQGSKIAN